MDQKTLEKYAGLLIDYCMELKSGEKLLVNTTTLAEPLVRQLFDQCMQREVTMDVLFDWQGKSESFAEYGHDAQAAYISPTFDKAVRDFDGYLVIRAPFIPEKQLKPDTRLTEIKTNANAALHKLYFERTGDRSLKRNLCQYPTLYGAKQADMDMESYTDFITEACGLNEENPADYWLDVRQKQQSIVDHLNKCTEIRYVGPEFDISFKTNGRLWINSDGRTNMPSGEVYTSPVEDSVNGSVHFSLPSLFEGESLENVRLTVKDGWIEKWTSDTNTHILDQVFEKPGTRRFGEAAIGTNYRIKQLTRNILFDEKIGGTIHMAVGQSYLQAGGKNESAIHWDMITDMTQGGQIYADGNLIYENGLFLI